MGGVWVGRAWLILLVMVASASAAADLTDLAVPTPVVATFENYAEGQQFNPSFTDSLSGIQFTNSTAVTGGFAIDYANSAGVAMLQDNNYMTANGWTIGNGGSLSGHFGFTGILPELADFVEMDVMGARISTDFTPYTVTLTAFNSVGGTIGSDTATFTNTAGVYQQKHLRVQSASVDIATFVLTNSGNGFNGFDNIAIPEPTAAVAVVAAAGMLMRRRRVIT